jgi:membrane protein DedA with SNARE-associated domain
VHLDRQQTICLAGIGLLGIYSLALLPLVPSLLGTDPLLLSALRGSTSSMVASGAFARVGEASVVLALIAPFLTLFVRPPFFWWAGKLWGRDAAQMLAGQGPRAEKWTRRVNHWAERYENVGVVLAYILPVPSALIFAGAGWVGMSLKRFLVLDLIGTSIWIGLNVGLGYAIGQSAVDVAKGIARYSLIFTVVLIVVAVVIGARRGRRVMPEPKP